MHDINNKYIVKWKLFTLIFKFQTFGQECTCKVILKAFIKMSTKC